MTLFQYPLMDHTKSREIAKKLYIYLPQNNPTVDLTATSNSDHYSVDKDDYEEDDLPTRNLSTTDHE